MQKETHRYRMVIEWSDADEAYLVSYPALAKLVLQPMAHGKTVVEAAREGEAALKLSLESVRDDGIDPSATDDMRGQIAAIRAEIIGMEARLNRAGL
jgi:predicted RNase H-like HicB family nuclease